MTGLIIFLCAISVFLLLFLIGDRDEVNRTNYAYAFCTCILAITAIVLKTM